MDGEAIFFTGRGGERQGQKSTGRGGAGKGAKSAGRGGARAGNILCVNLLNIQNLDRNHN